jgi:hypothetical protein
MSDPAVQWAEYVDPPSDQRLVCSVCNSPVWRRWQPYPQCDCPHVLLFTDCEGEQQSECKNELLRRAWDELQDHGDSAEEPGGQDPHHLLSPEGWVSSFGGEIARLAARLSTQPLSIWATEGEYSDGWVVSTVPVELGRPVEVVDAVPEVGQVARTDPGGFELLRDGALEAVHAHFGTVVPDPHQDGLGGQVSVEGLVPVAVVHGLGDLGEDLEALVEGQVGAGAPARRRSPASPGSRLDR